MKCFGNKSPFKNYFTSLIKNKENKNKIAIANRTWIHWMKVQYFRQFGIYVCAENKTTNWEAAPQYLLEAVGRSLRQGPLHQVVSQFPQVEQLLSVVLHRRWHQLGLQAGGKHRLHLCRVFTLERWD